MGPWSDMFVSLFEQRMVVEPSLARRANSVRCLQDAPSMSGKEGGGQDESGLQWRSTCKGPNRKQQVPCFA